MPVVRDLFYLLAALLTAPIWLFRMVRTGKLRTDWAGRLGRGPALGKTPGTRRLLLHAVSVGEVNAVRGLIGRMLEKAPGRIDIVISVTTDTGYAQAAALYAESCRVVRYPFDFSPAVRRWLDRIQPDLIALVELEVWPNLVDLAGRRGIPVGVINGRLTERSARRYGFLGPLVRSMFARLAFVTAQDEEYAARFRRLGVPEERVETAGTLKWDNAVLKIDPGAPERLAEALGIDRNRPLVVAGSTAPGEHELLAEVVPEDVQLLFAPRKPEWFDEAARVFPGCTRRSRGERGSQTGRFLLDTIGELRAAYALADIIIIGRTFVPLGGSDMIEAAALGKPVLIGPHVENFRETVATLLDRDAILQMNREELADRLGQLLGDPEARRSLSARAQEVVRQQQGATERHHALLCRFLLPDPDSEAR